MEKLMNNILGENKPFFFKEVGGYMCLFAPMYWYIRFSDTYKYRV